MNKRKIGLLGIAASLVGALFVGINFVKESPEEEIRKHGVPVRKLTKEEIDHPIYAQPFEVYDSLATDNTKYKNGNQDCSMDILGTGTNMEDVWNAYRGDGTTIAIIDTGIDYNHPDFKFPNGTSKILDTSRYYYVNSGVVTYNQYGVLGTSSYNFLDHVSSKNSNGVYELQYHGSNVASTAASAINGNGGCVGIAPNAKILVLKTDMNLSSINEAIKYATDQNVDVINMSLGAYDEDNGVSTYLSTAINSAYNKGIIVVAAAGNENTSTHSYPACNTHVIGVGALASKAYSKASFSNFNALNETSSTTNVNVDLSAPGYVYAASETATVSNTTVTNRQHSFTNTQGTSFASPIVAGAACLWKQAHPAGTPAQFESALYAACDDIGTSGWDTTYGHGALNIKKLLLSDSVTPTSVSVKAKDNVLSGKSGDHVQLYTQTLPLTTTEKSVMWSSSDSSIASVNDYSGVLTFGSKPGSATLTATSTANSSARGTIEVTNTTSVAVASVSFTNKTVTINKDSSGDVSTTFPYTVLPSGANQNVIFECNDSDSLEVDDGEWVSADVDKTVLLTVKSQEDPSKFDTCTVIIGNGSGTTGGDTSEGTEYSVSFVKSNGTSGTSGYDSNAKTSYVNGETNFKVNLVGFNNNAQKNVIGWDFVKCLGKGAYTATIQTDQPIAEAINKATISISAISSPSNISSCKLYVSDSKTYSSGTAYSFTPEAKDIEIEVNNPSGNKYYTFEFVGTKASSNGLITVTNVKFSSFGSQTQTVSLSSIKVSNAKTTYTTGDTFVKPTVTATYSDGNTKDVTSSATFTGYNLANQGIQTVTVSYTEKDVTKTDSYTITVSAPTATVTSVTISGATNNQEINVGDTLKLTATVIGTNNPSQSVTWSSSNNSYATVSTSGTVTAVAEGTVIITATSVANTNIKGTVTLKVIKPQSSGDTYYKNVDTSSMSALQSSLHTIISANTVDVGYDGLFNAYKTTDVKPGTNYLWDMYSDVNYTTTDSRINAQYHNEGDSINREHTIPQSWFNEASPMKADLFHVYPTDGYVNNRRSNYPHGDVSNASWTSNNGSKLGTGSNTAVNNLLGSDKKLFEVVDEYKGDFARSYFYFATRYSDKISSFTTDGKRMFKTTAPFMNDPFIDMYYAWHIQDPVSQKEIDRNNAVYSIQNNRNPYIDHPEWVAIAFGTDAPSTVDVTGVSLDQTSLELSVGASATLTATVAPSNATNKNVTWQSSDTSVATVSGGVVTAVSSGNATITVKTVDGNKTATCSVTVKSSGSTGGTEKTISITRNSFSKSGGYAWYDWSQDGVTGQAYIYSTTTTSMQFNGGKDGKALFSTTTLGNIKSVTVKASNTDRSWKLYGSNNPYTTTTTTSGTEIGTATTNGETGITFSPTENYRYFSLSLNATNAAYLTSIDVVYVEGGSTPVDPEIKGITLSETSKSIDLYSDSKTFTLTPTVSFVGDIDTTVSWTTSDSSVASISTDASENETPITVTANNVGSATITATCGEKSASCLVTITDTTNAHTLTSLELNTNEEIIPFMKGKGKYTVSATLIATFKDGHFEEVTPDTSNYEVLTDTLGWKEITATYGGLSAVKKILVTNNQSDVGDSTEETPTDTTTKISAGSSLNTWNTSEGITIESDANGTVDSERGFQWSKRAAEITVKGYNRIKKVELTVSANCSISSVTVAVGGVDLGTKKTIANGDKNVTLVFTNINEEASTAAFENNSNEILNGDIVISVSKGDKSFYLKSVDVTVTSSSSGESHDATSLKQVIAWSQYFLDMTYEVCSLNYDGDNSEGLSAIWSDLSTEYSYMNSDSKSLFMSSDDETVMAARERYIHIANHYGKNLNNFAGVASASRNSFNLFNSLDTFNSDHPENILTLILALTGAATIAGYFIVKKRKEI